MKITIEAMAMDSEALSAILKHAQEMSKEIRHDLVLDFKGLTVPISPYPHTKAIEHLDEVYDELISDASLKTLDYKLQEIDPD